MFSFEFPWVASTGARALDAARSWLTVPTQRVGRLGSSPCVAFVVPWLGMAIIALMLAAGTARAQARPAGDVGPDFDSVRRAAAVDSISTALNEVYVFPDVAKKMESLIRKNLKKGAYDDLADPIAFSDRLTEDLRSVSHDLHLRVFAISPEDAAPRPDTEEDVRAWMEEERARLARRNFGFQKLEILPGNVGYLRFDNFIDATFGETPRSRR
ncbi:MAG: hypothetical protein R3E97_09615 [Candidatus Eisenbacteria bacterium]